MEPMIWFLMLFAIGGFAPLMVILYKRRRARKLIANGHRVIAQVNAVTGLRYNSTTVSYSFYLGQAGPYTGSLNASAGKYRKGTQIIVFYDPARPQINTVEGAWESYVLLVFALVIGLFVVYAAFQLYEMAKAGV